MLRFITLAICLAVVSAQGAPEAVPTPAAAAPTVDLTPVTQSLSALSQSVSGLDAAVREQQQSQQQLLQTVQNGFAQQAAAPAPAASADPAVTQLTQSNNQLLKEQQQAVQQLLQQLSASQTSINTLSSTITEKLSSDKAVAQVAELKQETNDRLSKLEQQVADLKVTIEKFVSAQSTQTKSADNNGDIKLLLEQQQQLLSKLNGGFFDNFEDIGSQVKNVTFTYAGHLSTFGRRFVKNVAENYPAYIEQAKECCLHFNTHAVEYGSYAKDQATHLVLDSHDQLKGVLAAQGVPSEFVAYASIAIITIVLLITVVLALQLVFWILRTIVNFLLCRRGAAKNKTKQKKN